MTLKQAAEDALDVQNACNLSGVVRSFRSAMEAVWDEARRIGQGTDWVNSHPIAQLYASKVGDLSGIGGGSVRRFSDAYTQCTQLAGRSDE